MLTIYAPTNNLKSKAWEVFSGVLKSWPKQTNCLDNSKATTAVENAMFWGFVNNNLSMIHKLEANKQDYWFTDTPYFGRFDNNNLKKDNHYWRICKNNIHAKLINDCDSTRFDSFKIKVKSPKREGKHILVCPSSPGINLYLKQPSWLEDTLTILKKNLEKKIIHFFK